MSTLEANLASLITQLGTDWKNIWAKIGGGTLNTTATNVIAAINEVKTTADAAVAGTVPAASTTVAGKIELADDTEALAMSATDRALTPHNLSAIVNVNNGLAKLDAGGKVAAAQLPSYVDDVLDFANLAAFPATGSTGIIYVADDTNKTYRWTGTVYIEISPSPGTTDALAEGSTNLYFTNTRADTRADSRITARIGDETTNLVTLYTTAKS